MAELKRKMPLFVVDVSAIMQLIGNHLSYLASMTDVEQLETTPQKMAVYTNVVIQKR